MWSLILWSSVSGKSLWCVQCGMRVVKCLIHESLNCVPWSSINGSCCIHDLISGKLGYVANHVWASVPEYESSCVDRFSFS